MLNFRPPFFDLLFFSCQEQNCSKIESSSVSATEWSCQRSGVGDGLCFVRLSTTETVAID